MPKFDFSGWATRNDLQCADGLTIKKNAFNQQDGQTVSLVWNHQHNSPDNVIGHALLENREDGVYAYCSLNDTPAGLAAKKIVQHGDVASLSIWANQLKKVGNDVIHGVIREVSLVLAGANPGAFIDTVLSHGADSEEEMIIGYNENIMLYHSDEAAFGKKPENEDGKSPDEETVGDVFERIRGKLDGKEQRVLYGVIGMALGESGESENNDDKSKGGNEEMKHNVFDKETRKENFLSHADQEGILKMAKTNTVGSFKAALDIYVDEHLAHGGGEGENGDTLVHGIESIESLFPEYKDVRPGAPEMLTTDQGWVGKVLSKVHKSPISRIRTRQADVRDIEKLRAKGYKKGMEKGYVGNIKLIHRTTDPQTVYVKSKLDRDDIVDITDFDVVQYLYGIDRMNLNEELATAIMLGDGREEGDEGKIYADKIRPVWLDDELYTIHATVDMAAMTKELQGTNTGANFGENYIYAEAVIQSLLYAREKYKGSGTPDFYCTPHLLNVMLLARDLNGRRIYHTVEELRAALNVGEIITVEQFEGKTRTADGKTKKLLALMYNLSDYSLGATKGGEITHFTDFDIDFNQEKSLLETRCSGANTRVLSAIALEEDVTTPAAG